MQIAAAGALPLQPQNLSFLDAGRNLDGDLAVVNAQSNGTAEGRVDERNGHLGGDGLPGLGASGTAARLTLAEQFFGGAHAAHAAEQFFENAGIDVLEPGRTAAAPVKRLSAGAARAGLRAGKAEAVVL